MWNYQRYEERWNTFKSYIEICLLYFFKKLKSIINLLENQMLDDKFNEITEEIRLELLEKNLN